MKKFFLKIAMLVFCGLLACLFMGAYQLECSNSQTTNEISCVDTTKTVTNNWEADIVGDWVDDNYYFFFKSDKTVARVIWEPMFNEDVACYTWAINGNQITLSGDPGVFIGNIETITSEWFTVKWQTFPIKSTLRRASCTLVNLDCSCCY